MSKRQTMPNQVAFADNTRLARNKTPPLRISRRVKQAIDTIVHDRKAWDQAANEAGLTTRAMRLAIEKPHVLAYYKAQCVVLREFRRARNIHRLGDIADADDNMPAVNAIKALEQLSDEPTNKPNTASPGVTIRIVNIAAQPQHEQSSKLTNSTTNLDNMLITNDVDLSTKQIDDD
jgi:hypothetical protein